MMYKERSVHLFLAKYIRNLAGRAGFLLNFGKYSTKTGAKLNYC